MISRPSVLRAAGDIWQAKRGGSQAIQQRQQKRLNDLLDFSRVHSPFYRRLYQHVPTRINQLSDLPPVTKRDLMDHFNEWVTDPQVRLDEVTAHIADSTRVGVPFLGHYALWRTSGTTGTPGIFLHDAEAISVYLALTLVRGYMSWMSPGESWQLFQKRWRTAFVFATGGHFASNTFESITHRIRPGSDKTPPIFSAHMPLNELVCALNDCHPAVLSTYPSVLTALTHEQACGRLNIKPILIATGGECLKPMVKKQAAEVFQCRIWDYYAASEFMGIACECSHGNMHVNSDWVILEAVDADYRPIAPGQPPHSVLLTNLVNRVQPIIRYAMGDAVRFFSEPCPCGNPLPVITVEGRDDEILSFESPDGKWVDILPLPLATVVMVIPGVQRFQLIQNSATALKIRLETMPDSNVTSVGQEVVVRVQAYLASQGLASVNVVLSAEPPVQQIVSGKFRQVWSEWHAHSTL